MITDQELARAVAEFWSGRTSGTQSATHDKAFLRLVARDLEDLGWPAYVATSSQDRKSLLAGYFRPAKSWDIVCRDGDGLPRICIEFKSQVDSYGNNENNRYEEALGSGLDARALHGTGLVLGFLLVLCEEDATLKATRDRVPDGDPVFRGTSHVDRRAIFARRIVEFRLNEMPFYDAAALLLVRRDGTFRRPDDPDLDVRTFATRLVTAVSA